MGGAVRSAGGLLREPKDALQSADADAGVVCNFVGFEGQRKVTDECLLCWRGISIRTGDGGATPNRVRSHHVQSRASCV